MSSSTLKIIAIISMLIDHTGAVLFPDYIILRIIGRLAFPIFTYLIVEGYFHTRDVKKYLIRLFIFGIIAEVPFDLAFFGEFVYMGYQNVFFNLSLGLLAISLYDRFKETSLAKANFILMTIMLLATIALTDYNFIGILCIFIFYKYREQFVTKANIFIALMVVPSLMTFVILTASGDSLSINMFLQSFAILALIPIYFYNGKKGINLKYVFYAFYPVHLIGLYLISTYIMA